MNWPKVALGECCKIVSGATPKSFVQEYWGGDICWVTPRDLSELGDAYIASTPRKITESGLRSCAATVLPPGSVLLSSRAPIGHVAINTAPMATNQGFKSLVPDPERAVSKYLYHWLRARREYLESLGNGATFNEISKTTVARIEIPLPPLSEQRRIAAVLDQAEALRAKDREALVQLDALTESIFLDMFGRSDQDRWLMATVADVAGSHKGSIRTGPFGSQLLHEEFVDRGVAVLGIDNAVANEFRWSGRRFITDEKYRQLRRFTVHPGDVLITIMGTCGRCAIVPDNIPTAINTKHLCCITLDQQKCLPNFLHAYFLRHPIARRCLTQKEKGAIMSGLNMAIIKALPIPLVPIDLQRLFARRVEAIERLKQSRRAHLAELDALFESLQHCAFRGEL